MNKDLNANICVLFVLLGVFLDTIGRESFYVFSAFVIYVFYHLMMNISE